MLSTSINEIITNYYSHADAHMRLRKIHGHTLIRTHNNTANNINKAYSMNTFILKFC